MNYALDRETLAADLLQGVGVVATAPIPATVFGWSEQTPYTYDPEKAKSLLAEAGLADGFDTHVIWVPGSGPQDRELVLSFISNWADIGVNVESQEMEQAAWLEKLLALDWDMDFQTNTVRTGDADFTLRRLYTSTANRNGYANEELDQLLLDAAAEADQDVRLELYAQANKIIWDDAVGVFPFDLQTNYIMNKKIVGFQPTPSTIPNFATVTIGDLETAAGGVSISPAPRLAPYGALHSSTTLLRGLRPLGGAHRHLPGRPHPAGRSSFDDARRRRHAGRDRVVASRFGAGCVIARTICHLHE
jgi:peptide/nickel transport system substrate-binding protein